MRSLLNEKDKTKLPEQISLLAKLYVRVCLHLQSDFPESDQLQRVIVSIQETI